MPIISSWDKLTSKAKEALQAANYLASKHGNRELMPLHVLASPAVRTAKVWWCRC